MRLHDWLKPHIWTDVGRKIVIGEYNCMLYWDEEKRHYRVELKGHGNVGRSKLSAEDAIIDAKGSLGVKEDIKIPINVGDTVLGGKFKNKRIVVKDIGKNEKGDITINGRPLLKFRIVPQSVEEMDVIYEIGPEVRRTAKTGKSRDNLIGGAPNRSGFANTLAHYIDPLDPQKTGKLRTKPKYSRRNLNF